MFCDVDTRKDLHDSFVLSSGTTIFRGMVERMTNDLTALALFKMKINVDAPTCIDWRTYLVVPQISSEELCLFGVCSLALSS